MLLAASRSRLTLRNLLAIAAFFALLAVYHFRAQVRPILTGKHRHKAPRPAHSHPFSSKLSGSIPPSKVVSCIGPRGRRISESPDDQIKSHDLGPFPQPFIGSYEALGIEAEWSTAEERYAPYGYVAPEGQRSGGSPSPVDWDKVNWGELQMQCQVENIHNFPAHARIPFDAADWRLRLRDPNDDDGTAWVQGRESPGIPSPEQIEKTRTGRKLIIVRSYGKYKWTEADKMNFRAIVSELGLQSGGEYTVMLLVQIRDTTKDIFGAREKYRKALREAEIPPEFHRLTMLWDENLLESWYPKIDAHSVFYQISQSQQLLALFYPEFDAFWQLELDMRSLGHYQKMLRALDNFADLEPRKQSWERASYFHFPSDQGPYFPDFQAQVDASLEGGATIWGPMPIPEIPHPIGPPPPVARPEDDHFQWGVGEPADVVVTSVCSWVNRRMHWAFRDWVRNLPGMGNDTPRMMCPPATQRGSRKLLLAAHASQIAQGVAVPSEATLASFALWHGLKLSYPPLPLYKRDPEVFETERRKIVWYNGGRPGENLKLTDPIDPEIPAAQILLDDIERWRNGTLPDKRPEAAEWRADASNPPPTIPWNELNTWQDYYRGFAASEMAINARGRTRWIHGLTWWWMSSFPHRLVNVWSQYGFPNAAPAGEGEDEQRHIDELRRDGKEDEAAQLEAERRVAEEHEARAILRFHEGRWYAPAAWLHPVKTKSSQPIQ